MDEAEMVEESVRQAEAERAERMAMRERADERQSELYPTPAMVMQAGLAGAAPALAAGTLANPMQVAVVQAGWRSQLWRTLRVLAVAFLALSAIGALLDEKGVS